MIGYILENLLGFVLSLVTYLLRRRPRHSPSSDAKLLDRCTSVAKRGCGCFYDCAIFFTFSIHVACIVVLARLDVEVSASSVGDSTAKITWAVSLATMLPLTYITFNPDLLRQSGFQNAGDEKNRKTVDRREQLRFLLFGLCWMLFMYPFLSRMIETLGPSMIGGKNGAVTAHDWGMIEGVCFTNVSMISSEEQMAMKVFSIASSLLICVPTIVSIAWLSMRRQHGESRAMRYIEKHRSRLPSLRSRFPIVLFVAVPTIAITQLWTAFRERRFQAEISRNSGNQYLDSQWTFGQVVAVIIFVSVVIECWFSWLYE